MTTTEKFAALARIVASIAMTNNGKLMIARIDRLSDREAVPDLVAGGFLTYDGFLRSGDSVRVPGTRQVSAIVDTDPNQVHCYGTTWVNGPDYEAMILSRQEAAGYYD